MIIYTLSDPLTKEIRYVGLTTKLLKTRLSQHYSRKCSNHKCNWIKSLRKRNLKPLIEVLDYADSIEELNRLEIYWIEQLKQWGFSLVNLTQGGEGSFGYKHTRISLNTMKEKLALRPKKPPVNKMTKEEQYNRLSKKLSKKVIEYSIDGFLIKVWSSRLEAANFYKIKPSAIGTALKTDSNVCNGSFWRDYSENFQDNITSIPNKGNKVNVVVQDLLVNKSYFFKSLSEAFKFTGRPTSIKVFLNKEKLFKNRFKFTEC